MAPNDIDMRARVLMSMQRALLGGVTSELRGVAVSWDHDRIDARFLYDAGDTQEAAEIVSEIETEVLADFGPSVTTTFTRKRGLNLVR